MPRKSESNKYHTLQTCRSKKTAKNVKKKDKSVNIPVNSPIESAPEPSKDKQHDENEVIKSTVVAQIHQSVPNLAHEKNIIPTPAFRYDAVLSDSRIMEILDSSHSQSGSQTTQPPSQSAALVSLDSDLHLLTTTENHNNENVFINSKADEFTKPPISASTITQTTNINAPQDVENTVYCSLPTLLFSSTPDEKADDTTFIALEKTKNRIKLPTLLTTEAQVPEKDSSREKTFIPKPAFRNGAVLSDPGIIERFELSQPQSNNQSTQPQFQATGVLSATSTSHLHTTTDEQIYNNVIVNYTASDQFTTSPISPSTITNDHEVIIRTSHDPENNVVIEEIDILPNDEEPMDTSTPIASPSISTIMQNIESENINSFNINTPTSSFCAHSPVNEDTYAPSSSSETSDTTKTSNNKEKEKKKKRKVKKKSDIGRIRKVKKSEWIDSKRKELKNKGLSYVSRNGKARSEKTLLPPCDDHCRLKCKNKINEDARKQMFKKYWSLGDRVRQWDLLTRWCERIGKRRMTTEGPSKRMFSIKYSLPAMLGQAKDEKVTVCKKMFLNTFAIGEGIVRTALKKIADDDGFMVARDERGRHLNHPKVKNDEMIRSVCDHVKSLTPIESHYTRKESSKLYLDGDLTMSKMFKLYNEWVSESNSDKAITVRQYTDIVNENFNIEFHRPKKDQCDECIAFKNLPKPVNQQVSDQYKEHLRNKDRARSLKNEDKLSAINSPDTTVTAAFDFQKVHSSPHAASSILYYKRKLNVFNFTIFEMGKKVGKCYMWHEGTAKRGANEVSSCVYDFIKEQSANGIQTVNLYSDNCGGQNRNRIVFMMYLIAAKEFKVNITHRFLEKGHTQNENDSMHALIERCAKNKEIYTPDQWFALARWAKETGNPYTVKEIATEDIYDFKKVLIGKNWTKNEKNQKIMWSKIKEVHVSSAEPDILYYKLNFDETYHSIVVRRSQNRRRQNILDDELIQAYTGPLPIPDAKLIDLKYLCEHNIIPRQYHGFYDSLASGDVTVSSSDEEN